MAKNIIIQCGKGLKLINNINTRLHLQDNHVNRRLISYLRIFFIQLLGGRKIGYASKISLADFCSLNCGYCKTLLGSLLQRLFFFALLLKQTCIFIIHLYYEFAKRGRIGFYSVFFYFGSIGRIMFAVQNPQHLCLSSAVILIWHLVFSNFFLNKQTNATVIFLFAIFCLNYSCFKGGSNWTILSSVKLEVTTPLKIIFGTIHCQGSL